MLIWIQHFQKGFDPSSQPQFGKKKQKTLFDNFFYIVALAVEILKLHFF